MNEKVAAIVLNYNGFEETKECIESLKVAGFSSDSIYLVDNCSPDQSGEKLKQLFPPVNFSQCGYNSGYGAGNNYGIRKAFSDGFPYILIVNNDVVVEPGFLQPLIKELGDDDAVGAATGKVLYKKSPHIINAAGGKFSKLLCTGINLRIGEVDDHRAEKKDIDFIPGMLILLKREVIERVGLLDENYFLYYEDIDYSFRIKKLYKMTYTSASTVYHKSGGGIKGKMYSGTYLYYYTRNRFWFFREMPFGYSLYVFIFSLFNCLQKSMIVLGGKSNERKRKLIMLWSGFFAGAFGNKAKKDVLRIEP
ncbi:MAG: glycosyltransferase family 2 protein [Bacteroidota bacterium]